MELLEKLVSANAYRTRLTIRVVLLGNPAKGLSHGTG